MANVDCCTDELATGQNDKGRAGSEVPEVYRAHELRVSIFADNLHNPVLYVDICEVPLQ